MSEVIGKIHLVGEEQVFGFERTFRKRQVVIETTEQYSQKVPIDFVQDKCEYLDGYRLGEEVKVSINIRGNEYQGKYYVSLNGWKIERIGSAQSSPRIPPQEVYKEPTPSFNKEDHDDLPF